MEKENLRTGWIDGMNKNRFDGTIKFLVVSVLVGICIGITKDPTWVLVLFLMLVGGIV